MDSFPFVIRAELQVVEMAALAGRCHDASGPAVVPKRRLLQHILSFLYSEIAEVVRKSGNLL